MRYKLWTIVTLILTGSSGLAMGWMLDWAICWPYPIFRIIGVLAGMFAGCLARNVPEEAFDITEIEE